MRINQTATALLLGAALAAVLAVSAQAAKPPPAPPPQLAFSPNTWDFGSITEGSVSAPKDFTLGYTGKGASGRLAITLGASGDAFTITQDGCTGRSLKGQTSCTVRVEYAPQSAGQSDGTPLSAATAKSLAASASLSGRSPSANQAPSADSRTIGVAEDTATPITLSGGDPDGDELTFSITGDPAHGTLDTIETPYCWGSPSSCSADVTFTPDAGYIGTDSFTFQTNDGTLDSETATVSITVSAPGSSQELCESYGGTFVGYWSGLVWTCGPLDYDAAQETALTVACQKDNSIASLWWTPSNRQYACAWS
jgi:hypothetical protein